MFAVTDGTRFDAGLSRSRRINGIRNFRQALASPYPVYVTSTIRRGHSLSRSTTPLGDAHLAAIALPTHVLVKSERSRQRVVTVHLSMRRFYESSWHLARR